MFSTPVTCTKQQLSAADALFCKQQKAEVIQFVKLITVNRCSLHKTELRSVSYRTTICFAAVCFDDPNDTESRTSSSCERKRCKQS